MECEQKELIQAHLRALSEELRYRIGEVKRALERLEDTEKRLAATPYQTQNPPF